MLLSASTALVAVTATALLARAPHVVLTTAGHSPVVGKRWSYTLRVSEGGRPVSATLTAEIVDPIGGVHPLPFGGTAAKDITNWRFTGTFANFVTWPAESRGIPLTLRLIVTVAGARTVENYDVTPGG